MRVDPNGVELIAAAFNALDDVLRLAACIAFGNDEFHWMAQHAIAFAHAFWNRIDIIRDEKIPEKPKESRE